MHMPHYVPENCENENAEISESNIFLKRKREKLAKLKLFGGQNASKKKFNWVVQISEIGYKDGESYKIYA